MNDEIDKNNQAKNFLQKLWETFSPAPSNSDDVMEILRDAEDLFRDIRVLLERFERLSELADAVIIDDAAGQGWIDAEPLEQQRQQRAGEGRRQQIDGDGHADDQGPHGKVGRGFKKQEGQEIGNGREQDKRRDQGGQEHTGIL